MNREEAINLKEHPNWDSLCEEIDKIIDGIRNKLESANDPAEVVRLQERIKALRGLKTLPQDIIDRES